MTTRERQLLAALQFHCDSLRKTAEELRCGEINQYQAAHRITRTADAICLPKTVKVIGDDAQVRTQPDAARRRA